MHRAREEGGCGSIGKMDRLRRNAAWTHFANVIQLFYAITEESAR